MDMLFSAVALQVLLQFLRLIFYSMMTQRLGSLVLMVIEIIKVCVCVGGGGA